MFKESYMREETQQNMLASVWWAYAAKTLIEPALKFTYVLVCMHALLAYKKANTHTRTRTYARMQSWPSPTLTPTPPIGAAGEPSARPVVNGKHPSINNLQPTISTNTQPTTRH